MLKISSATTANMHMKRTTNAGYANGCQTANNSGIESSVTSPIPTNVVGHRKKRRSRFLSYDESHLESLLSQEVKSNIEHAAVNEDRRFDQKHQQHQQQQPKQRHNHLFRRLSSSSGTSTSKDYQNIFPSCELHYRYEFVRYLGRGAYGHVCEAVCKVSGQRVAVKKIMNVFENRQEAKRILRECRILRELKNNKHITDIIEVLPPLDPANFQNLLIVFEFVDTDLSKIIEHTDQFFTVRHVQYFLYQLLLSLQYIHSAKIVHRDLKPANILINEDCSLKLCDFGLSRGLDSTENQGSAEIDAQTPVPPNGDSAIIQRPQFQRTLTRHVVTRYYRAPEILVRAKYTTLVDVWSVGCILGDLLGMQNENFPNRKDRAPLFPGLYSSFSPAARPNTLPSDDQLRIIFEIIGVPNHDEIEKLECCDTEKRLLYKLSNKLAGTPRFPYNRIYKATQDVEYMWQFQQQQRPENSSSNSQKDSSWNDFDAYTTVRLQTLYQKHLLHLQQKHFQQQYRSMTQQFRSMTKNFQSDSDIKQHNQNFNDSSKLGRALSEASASSIDDKFEVKHLGKFWRVDFKKMEAIMNISTLNSVSGEHVQNRIPSESIQQVIKIRRLNAALDLLDHLLKFDVDKRFTVDQALKHPFLRAYNDESSYVTHSVVKFEFEDLELSRGQIRALILEEVRFYHRDFKPQNHLTVNHRR